MNATRLAIENIAAQDADERLVFVISDANVGRYDITPESLGSILTRDPRVSAYIVFIAEQVCESYTRGYSQ